MIIYHFMLTVMLIYKKEIHICAEPNAINICEYSGRRFNPKSIIKDLLLGFSPNKNSLLRSELLVATSFSSTTRQ